MLSRSGPAVEGLEDEYTQKVDKMRRIPWQTPHTFDKEGKLLMDSEAERWLRKATAKREKLAEEVRAEADPKTVATEISSNIRREWIARQKDGDQLKVLFEHAAAGRDGYRLNPDDGCFEKK